MTTKKKKTYCVCFVNQKGGVGKTTTTVQTAAYLFGIGKKVLMVDLDAQGNLTLNMKVNTEGKNTICELLLGEATFEETVVSTSSGDILPADDSLGLRELIISGRPGREFLLKKALSSVVDRYDYILLDCPPAVNTLVYNALMVATDIVIVVNASAFSAQGCSKLIEKLDNFQDVFDKKFNIAGLLFTQYSPTNLEKTFATGMAELVSKHKVYAFEHKIKKAVAIGESQARQMSIFEYKPNHEVAIQYKEAIKEIISKLKGE